jgi:hypothetical protein
MKIINNERVMSIIKRRRENHKIKTNRERKKTTKQKDTRIFETKLFRLRRLFCKILNLIPVIA